MSNPQISVIIVSYNTREMTLDCLRVLFENMGDTRAEVFVVDNASIDGSAAAIKAAFPSVQLIENPENAGFGAANNLAMERARGEYFLLLNSDAFIRPGAIQALIDTLQRDKDIAAVGPKLLNKDGTLQRSCWRFPSPGQAWIENLGLAALLRGRSRFGDYRRWAHDSEKPVDFAIGACLLIKRDVYEKIGGFDPSFWMYAEETDWQKRMRTAGYSIWFTPRAEVEHWGGASGASNKARISESFFNSLDIYSRKHHGMIGLLSLRLAMIVGNTLRMPLWFGLWLAKPRGRTAAREKLRLGWWLLRRQSTKWKLGGTARP
ncbi:glycosyltransferase family 2 protein [bacterium]|nr:MAG: glycosyltransferase family 2 protein [bacterium]